MHNYYFTFDNIRKFYVIKKTGGRNGAFKLDYNHVKPILESLISQNLTKVVDDKQKIVLVFESSQVVIDNIAVFRAQDKTYDEFFRILLNKIADYLEKENLKAYKKRLPNGFTPTVNRSKHKNHKLAYLLPAAALSVLIVSGVAKLVSNSLKNADDLATSITDIDDISEHILNSFNSLGPLTINNVKKPLPTEMIETLAPIATLEPTAEPTLEPTAIPTEVPQADNKTGAMDYDEEMQILFQILNVTPYQYNKIERTLMHEGGQLNYEESCALMSVALNRLTDSGFPNNLYEIITQKNQFNSYLNGHWRGINPDNFPVARQAFKDTIIKFIIDQNDRFSNWLGFRGRDSDDPRFTYEYNPGIGNKFGAPLNENNIIYLDIDPELREDLIDIRNSR